jgi:serine protease Do
MQKFKFIWPLIFGFVGLGVIIGIILTFSLNIDSKGMAGKQNSGKIYVENTAMQTAAGDNQSQNVTNFNPNTAFVEVVKKVRPSIVTIYTTRNIKVPANPWHRFFREFGFDNDRGDQNEEEQEFQQGGLGSGIIINKEGYILTNSHVIKDVDELTVKLVDDEEYKAKVIGIDPTTDVALIQIKADNLPIAILGNSDQLQIGEWVLAIGSPLELNFTVTAGIVSALGRDINIIQDRQGFSIENFIQTDAAINPGNSGGALVNINGEVIGVNSAIATPTGNYIGYGFAIPINLAKTVVDDFIKYGEVRRGYIGVSIKPMTQVIAKGVGLDKPRGVFINDVLKGQAADKAGIKPGDVILEVDGVEMHQPNQLQAKISSYDPGDKVELMIWRDGKQKSFQVILQSREGELTLTTEKRKQKESKIENLGLRVKDLTSDELNKLDLESGVLLQSIQTTSPAFKEGLRTGDVIYKIDGKAVESVSMFIKYIEALNAGDIIKLQTRRRGPDGGNFDSLIFVQIPENK